MKGKTKLRKLKLTSVDMVRRGANPDAYINLYKSAEEPASKSMFDTIVDAVKSALGMGDIEKKADTFDEKIAQREVADNRWKYQDALNMSIDSIINDEDLTYEQKSSMIGESVEQFAEAYKELCCKIAAITKNAPEPAVTLGKSSEEETLDEDEEKPAEGEIEDEEGNPEALDEELEDIEEPEEGEAKMKIDKSRFTDAELEQYNALIAKGLVEEDDDEYIPEIPKKKTKEETEVDKEIEDEGVKKAFEEALAEMAELKKSMEIKELTEVAKKYTILGKNEEELVNTLYVMKSASPEAYDSYINVLDESLEVVNKSGMFTEIGKSAHVMAGGSTEAKIATAATEIQKADPNLSRVEAIAKAWEQHPELVEEYENEYRK